MKKIDSDEAERLLNKGKRLFSYSINLKFDVLVDQGDYEGEALETLFFLLQLGDFHYLDSRCSEGYDDRSPLKTRAALNVAYNLGDDIIVLLTQLIDEGCAAPDEGSDHEEVYRLLLDWERKIVRHRLRHRLASLKTEEAVSNSDDDKALMYESLYSHIAKIWKDAERVYKNWVKEIDSRGPIENLQDEEWKRRIHSRFPGFDLPDGLLNRLVRIPQSPLFVANIDDYARTPSRLAAIHTARICEIPDDLSYETYMRLRRKAESIKAVIDSSSFDDSKNDE